MKYHEKTVLIADDEEDLTWSISNSLNRDGKNIRVLCANSGDSVIELLKKTTVDLLVTDLRMPGLDGHSVVQFVMDNALPTKVIVITAFGSEESKNELMKKGCLFYVEKPFEMSALKQKIYSVLDHTIAETYAEGDLSEQIKQVLRMTKNLPDLLMVIHQGNLEGKLYFSYGKIYHAELGKKRGRTALKEIMKWENGFVKAQSGQFKKPHSIDS